MDYITEREEMEDLERDDEYEYEQALYRSMRRRQRLEWEEAEADRDFLERDFEDEREIY